MNPGLYPNVAFKDYLAIQAASNSYLGKLDCCPAKAKVEQKETPSMSLGRAVHKVVLEGKEAFFKEYAIAPEVDRRTKAGKETYAEFEGANPGKVVLPKGTADAVLSVGNAVFRHPMASKILSENVTEQTVIWQDKGTGLLCKARPDAVPDEGKMVLIDLKTTADASETAFTRSIIKYGYARQAAFYIDGYNAATKGKVDAFIFIAVETEEPYRTEVYRLDDDFISYGRERYKDLLSLEKKCREKNFYPHYTQEFSTIFKPAYLF